jgi:prolipoprotein diacylglyceryltransferase
VFERIFLVYVLVGVASGIWSMLHISSFLPAGMPQPMLAAMPMFMIGGVIGTIVVDLLLWFFIARRGADIARWIFVVLFALGAVGVLRSLLGHPQVVLPATVMLVSALRLVLDGICTALLFRPDAARWFKGERTPVGLHDTFS